MGYCFVDKNKDVPGFLAANMESLADNVKGNIDHKNLEHFHEFLRGFTDIFTNKIDATKDYAYHHLRDMIQNKDIVVVKGDFSVVIMKKSDYVTKLDAMINHDIMKDTYVETTDNTLKEISQFQDFLYKKFHNCKRYKDMQPDSHQTACIYRTVKTHKFETLQDITAANLKFRPIIDQTGTFTYNAAKVISDYLRPLCKKEYPINDTQKFPSMLSSIPLLQDGVEHVSCDIELLFTNMLVQETINYIIE